MELFYRNWRSEFLKGFLRCIAEYPEVEEFKMSISSPTPQVGQNLMAYVLKHILSMK